MAEQVDRVWLLSGDPDLSAQVIEISELVGIRIRQIETVSACPDVDVDLLLVDIRSGRSALPNCPIIRLGEGGDLHLPRDAHQLAQVFAQLLNGRAGKGEPRILFVAGWGGGAGATTSARELARAGSAIMLDASGHPLSLTVPQQSITWGLVDADDPPPARDLQRKISKVLGVRILGPRSSDVVVVDDPRVGVILQVCPQPVVVDCGVWNPRIRKVMAWHLGQNRPVGLVLVGPGDTESAPRLASVLADGGPLCLPRLLLGVGRASLELRMTTQAVQIPLRARPARTARKRWTRLWNEIWRD